MGDHNIASEVFPLSGAKLIPETARISLRHTMSLKQIEWEKS